MIPTLFGAALLVFMLLRAIPGDVCEVRLAGTGLYADPAEIELCRENLGLNKPLILGWDTQFTDFVGGYLTFDLGDSMWTGRRALKEVHEGELDPRAASAMASIAGALIRAFTAGELEERLAAVERQHKQGAER